MGFTGPNNMNSPHDIGDPTELAGLFAAGSMSELQTAEYLKHLDDGCPRCSAELSSLAPAIESLALSLAPVAPPPRVRENLFLNISAAATRLGDQAPSLPIGGDKGKPQVWKDWASDKQNKDLLISRGGQQEQWEETGEPGVRIRRLFVDRQRDQFTALVRMEPGASYPKHIHNGPEECLVIEGKLRVGDSVLDAGDYQYAPPGSLHGVQSTDCGCLLLIVSSLSDEMV